MTPGRKAYCGWLRVVAILWPLTIAFLVLVANRGQDPAVDIEWETTTPPAVQSFAESLIAEHDCRVSGYGDQVIPGHAVIDTGSGPRYTSSQPAFDIWEGKRTGKIYAWCI